MTQQIISLLNETDRAGKSRARRICEKFVMMAEETGDPHLVKEIIDRVEGKVPQAVEMTGRGGGPMEVIDRTLTPQQAAQAYAATLGSEDAGLDGESEGASVH